MKQRNIALCILFSIITCNLYALYWMMQITEDTNNLAKPLKRISGGKVLLFEIITLGIYIYFWSWRTGALLSDARTNRGLPPKDSKLVYLLWLFLIPLVSLSLMQNEINHLYSGEAEDNSLPVSGKRACIPGIVGSILFFILSLQLQSCFSLKGGLFNSIAMVLAPWIMEHTSIIYYQLICLLAGISVFLLIPLFVYRTSGRPVGIWNRLIIGAIILLGITLLIYGIKYQDFFLGFDMSTFGRITGISMGIGLFAVSASISGYCFSEYKYLRHTHSLGSDMAVCGALFAIAALIVACIPLLTKDFYFYPVTIPLYLPYPGILLILFALLHRRTNTAGRQ